jgi:hypothetical protein
LWDRESRGVRQRSALLFSMFLGTMNTFLHSLEGCFDQQANIYYSSRRLSLEKKQDAAAAASADDDNELQQLKSKYVATTSYSLENLVKDRSSRFETFSEIYFVAFEFVVTF